MNKYMLLLLTALLIASCGKGPETVVVQSDNADLFRSPDPMDQSMDSTASDTFRQLRIGEIAAIESLDPLYATSNSERRIIQLIYDGLTALDSLGKPIPALAKRWTVNKDSTEFIFHLNTNTYFHDSPVFENGVGRKLTASDVRYVFERMASNQVPDFAADHFTDLRGFEAYHNEQVFVKNPARRVVNTINGLKISNDSTIVIVMNESTGNLLERLAHPMASIYPKESVKNNTEPIQQAAGTGPYQFIKKEDNAHLLTAYSKYQGAQAKLNRLDIVSGLSERMLFQRFAQQNIDALIELSPSIMQTIADSSGALLSSYYRNYKLEKSPASSDYQLFYNLSAGQLTQVNAFLAGLDLQALINAKAFGMPTVYTINMEKDNEDRQAPFVVTQSEHPIQKFMLDKLAVNAASNGTTFSMNASYALMDGVTFSNTSFPGTQLVLDWEIPVYILTQNSVQGIRLSGSPWNLNLNKVQLTGTDK